MLNKIFSILKSRSIISLFLRVLGMGFSYLFSLFVTHKCGAEGWGILSIIFTLTLFGSYIFKFGFDTALLKFAAENEAKNNRSLTFRTYILGIRYILIIAIGISLLFWLLSGFIASHLFGKDNLTAYIPYVSLLIVPTIMTLIHSEGLRGLGKVYQYSLLQNSSALGLSTCVLMFISLYCNDIDWTSTVLVVYSFTVMFLYIISQISWGRSVFQFRNMEDKVSVKRVADVAMPMFWSGVMLIAIGWTDTLLLGIFSTEKDVGIYNVALRICNLVIIGKLALNSIVASQYAQLYTLGNIHELQLFARSTSKKILITSVPVILLIMLFPQFFLGLFGEEFKEGAIVLMILSAGQFINSACGTPDVILQMTGHEALYKNIMIVALLINLAVNLALIPFFGITGSAIASFIGLSFWNIVSVIFVKKRLRINILCIV